MHFMGNQYVDLEPGADAAFVETYAVAYHMEAADSGRDDLIMGVRYQDTVARDGDGWLIINRVAKPVWVRGPLPRRVGKRVMAVVSRGAFACAERGRLHTGGRSRSSTTENLDRRPARAHHLHCSIRFLPAHDGPGSRGVRSIGGVRVVPSGDTSRPGGAGESTCQPSS